MTFTKHCALGAAALFTSTTFFASAAAADDCSVTMAEMNWPSAELMANVDAIILEEGYGCDVELVTGGTTTIFASMSEKGEPEVAPELWINAVATTLNAAKEEGTMSALNAGPITGLGEGWWVTKAFLDANPELNTVEKILERPDLFPDAEDASKGAFMGCPAGWACQLINANLFRAFDMEEKGWTLVDPGSAAGLDGAIAKASERGEAWFGYYWNPTSLVGKYDLQMIPFEAEYAGDDNWNNCLALAEQDCEAPVASSWIESKVETVVTAGFMEKASAAAAYFEARTWPGESMNGMLVYMGENQATGEDAAYEFLLTQEDLWTQWVPADIAEKVMDAL